MSLIFETLWFFPDWKMFALHEPMMKYQLKPPRLKICNPNGIQMFTCLTRISVGIGDESLRLLIWVETGWKGAGAWSGLSHDDDLDEIFKLNIFWPHKIWKFHPAINCIIHYFHNLLFNLWSFNMQDLVKLWWQQGVPKTHQCNLWHFGI